MVREVPRGSSSSPGQFVRQLPDGFSWGINLHRARYVFRTEDNPVLIGEIMEAFESGESISVTDKFETFTGIVEECKIVDFDGEKIAQVTIKQVDAP